MSFEWVPPQSLPIDGRASQPEQDDCSQSAGGQEHLGTPVVSHRNPAPVLEAGEHVLDAVALAVEDGVMGDDLLAALAGRNAGFSATVGQSSAEPVSVITSVGDQHLGLGQ